MNIRYIDDFVIEKYLQGKATVEEVKIIRALKDLDENRDRFNRFLDEYGTLPLYSNLIEEVKANSQSEIRAGQIWRVKRIPDNIVKKGILPVAQWSYIYLLTSPEPPFIEGDDDFLEYYPEYHTFYFLPISLNIEFATNRDIIFSPNNELLGLPFMIITDCEMMSFSANLDLLMGLVPEAENEKILNMYFKYSGMEYDEVLLKETQTGRFHDLDFGDIYDYRGIVQANFEYLQESIEEFYAFFSLTDLTEVPIEAPQLLLAADDDKVSHDNSLKVPKNEVLLYQDELIKSVFSILEKGVILIKVFFGEITGVQTAEIRLSIISGGKNTRSYPLNISKSFESIKIDSDLSGKSLEVSLILDKKCVFMKFLKL